MHSQVQERDYVEKRNFMFYPTPLGRALLAGYNNNTPHNNNNRYDAMGIDMGRPQQRARMERGMKEVADGRQARTA